MFVLVTSVGTMYANGTKIGDFYYYYNGKHRVLTYESKIASENYPNLEEANIPARLDLLSSGVVGTIGDSAFFGCKTLRSVTIPQLMLYISKSAFDSCPNLTSLKWLSIYTHNYSTPEMAPFYPIRHQISSMHCEYTVPPYLCYEMENLLTVTIGDTVSSIGDCAFYGCKNLTSIDIPRNVSNIGKQAFSGCKNLSSIYIPKKVSKIGEKAFYDCDSIRTFDVSPDNMYFCEIDGVLFNYDTTQLIRCPQAKQGAFVIPASVKYIANFAFDKCKYLTSIQMSDSLISIGDGAFRYCAELTSIDIPQKTSSIGGAAFYGCSKLNSVNMHPLTPPSTDGYISNSIFANTALSSVYVPCGTIDVYKNDKKWSQLSSLFKYIPLPYDVTIIPSIHGTVDVPTSCSGSVIYAMPDAGCHFIQWSDGNTDNPRYIELMQDTTFEAFFATSNYTVDLKKNHPEMGSVTGGGSYEYLSQVTISATPNYGYHFVQWNGVGRQIPQNSISASQAYSIAAALGSGEKTSKKYTIVGYITGTYGTYSNSYYISDDPNIAGTFIVFKCSSSANIGDCVSVEGYLTNYKGTTPETTSGGSLTVITIPSQSDSIYSFTLTQDTTIIAEFVKNIYTLSLQSANPKMGAVTGGGQFEYLTQCAIKATPSYGYHFAKWSDNNTDNPRVVTLTCDTAFSASFGKNPVIRYIYDSSMGYIEGDTTLVSQASGNITFKAVPYPGYKFMQWSDGNTDNPRTINICQDTTMEANFAIATKGNCGKDFALTWTLDVATMALSIVGEGELTENFTYGSYVKSVTIGADVTDIGFDAFVKCHQLKYVVLNSSAVVSKDYDYYYSSFSGYVYKTLANIFGTGVEEYTLGGYIERIGDYAFYGSSGLKKVVISEGCKHIGDHAFGKCGNIVTIVCPSTVEYIGTDAFSSESIMNVYNYALTPQDMSVNNLYTGYGLTLLRGVLATARLYVPQQSIELYRDAYFWCYFGNIMPIPATSVDVNDISITTTETTVTVVWPHVDGADTYELVVKDNDGNVICTLIFNAQGQLTQITFNAQARDNAPQQTQSTGFEFTITGLKEGSPYDLIMTARDSHGSVLQTRTISFTTKSETPTVIEDIHKDSDTPTKILRNNQIFILRGDKVYTLQGQEIR